MINNIDITYIITPCIDDYKPVDYFDITEYEMFWLKLKKTFYGELDDETEKLPE